LDTQCQLEEKTIESHRWIDHERLKRLNSEVEDFDDIDSYRELMTRPYTRRLKAEVDRYLSSVKLKGARILELGCGISEHAHYFNKDNIMILTDINWALLEKNSPPSRLMLCDAQVLKPFDDNSIDFIMYIGILHHLHDQTRALREGRRVLKPGGRIFICEPHRKSINFIYYNLRLLVIKIFGAKFLRKLIGCVSPDEKQLDVEAVESIFGSGYSLRKWTILSFRLPPLRLFRRLNIDVALSDIFDKLPLFRSVGTTILYEIKCLEKADVGKRDVKIISRPSQIPEVKRKRQKVLVKA
jgi:ubiquinone/menaquinone biosynthesis C-methylase UbiE